MALFPDITRDDVFRLETKHLWLRWLRANDAAALTAIVGLAEVAQMTASIPHPYPPGEAGRFILTARARCAGGEALVLAATSKAKSQPLVGIVSAEPEGGELELGYLIASHLAGRGYATEAAMAMIDAVFNLTETRVVTANCRVINPASRRVLEKSGFALVGSGLKDLPARGGRHPCDGFALDRHAWSARVRAVPRLPAMAHQRSRDLPRDGEHPQ